MTVRRRARCLGLLGCATLLSIQAVGCAADPERPVRGGLAGAIDSLVLAAMDEGPIAGVSVAVGRGLRVMHLEGYGFADLENRLPATPSTVYHIGSITKQFTAAAVMQLVEAGRLRLDGRVRDYLPAYAGPAADVTIEALLNHTAGVPNYTTMESWWRTLPLEMTPLQMVSVFREEPLDFPSGSRFSYSNSGYVLLGYIIDQVSGQPYGGYLNEHLFVPLQLESTRYCDDHALIPNRARGYQVVDGEFFHASRVSMSQAYAAGAICSSAYDLLRWTRLLATGAAVDEESYRAMTRAGRLADGSVIEYGYGLASSYLDGHHRVSHFGGMLGFTGQAAYYDEDNLIVVVLTNTEAARAASLATAIARLVLELEPEETLDILLTAEELEWYTGTYDLNITSVDVTAAEGRLIAKVSVPGIAGRYVLLHQGGRSFQAESDPEIQVEFTGGEDGADGFVLVHKGITMRGERMAAAPQVTTAESESGG